LLRAAMERGVAVYQATGMAAEQGGDAVMVAPPFVIGEAEVELIARVLRESFDSVYQNLHRA
jgi:adenosylmethionine-8-amino-7-oxononanoate aminotransferase